MTTRLSQTIEAIGLATCGELGARFAPRLGIVTSPTTILRRTMTLSTCPPEQVSLLGIDDWSLRRGRQFGTILVTKEVTRNRHRHFPIGTRLQTPMQEVLI
jgi:hypothetical protein